MSIKNKPIIMKVTPTKYEKLLGEVNVFLVLKPEIDGHIQYVLW